MKFSIVKTFAFILTAFMLGCNEFMVVGVLSNIARSYHVSLSTFGFLVTSFALIYAISTPIVTTLTSRFDRYWLLIVLMGIFLLANTLTALAPNLFWLFASRILTASVAGTLITTIYLYVNLLTPMAKKPLVIRLGWSWFQYCFRDWRADWHDDCDFGKLALEFLTYQCFNGGRLRFASQDHSPRPSEKGKWD